MILLTIFTVLDTLFITLLLSRALVWLAMIETERDWLDDLACRAYALCERLGLSFPEKEIKDVVGLDRYPDGPNPFIQFITKIVVPTEYARVQVMLALRYLHDQHTTDTNYMAVNQLTHLYGDERGEPTGITPWIVVDADATWGSKINP